MADPRAAAKTRLRRQRLLAGPVGRVLFNLSWPLSLGLFSVIAFNVVDTLYIGRLGPEPLAAIGYCFPIIFCMSAVAIGLGNGATSVVSRSLGRKDFCRARIRITDTILFTTALSLLMVGGMFLIDDAVYGWLAVPAHLIPYIRQYMDIWYVGLPLLMQPIVLNGLIRATGDAIFPSAIMVMAAGINAVVSPFLVFGLWGAPDLGMAGAAWATIIARGTLVIVALWYLWRQELVHILGHNFEIFFNSVAEILRYSVPAFLAQVVSPFSSAVIIRLLSSAGPDTVAAYTVATRIESLILVPLFSLGAGISPFTGQNSGAGQPERLLIAENRAISFSLIWGAAAALFLFLFGHTIAGVFTTDPDIQAQSAKFMTFIGLGIWGAGFLYVAVGVTNPLGYPNLGMGLSIFRNLILFAGISLIAVNLVRLPPEQVILYTAPSAYILAGLTAALVTRWLIKKQIRAMARNEARPIDA